MGLSWGKRFIAAAATVVLAAAMASGQSAVLEEGKRKIKSRTSPQYPDLARRMNLSGEVRIELVIAPDGHVKNARAIGGHPVLVQACLEAVKEWKFEATPGETKQIVEFVFKL